MPNTRPSLESHLSGCEAITIRSDSLSAIQPANYTTMRDTFQARGRTIYNPRGQIPSSQSTGHQCHQDARIRCTEASFMANCALHDEHDVRMEIPQQPGFATAGGLEEYLINMPEGVTSSKVSLSLTGSSKALAGEKINPSMGRLTDEEAHRVADEMFHAYIDKTVFCPN